MLIQNKIRINQGISDFVLQILLKMSKEQNANAINCQLTFLYSLSW